MKSLFFTKFRFSCTKNLSWIVFLFVLWSVHPVANAGNNYVRGYYKVTVKPQDQTVGRGRGKVYLDGKGQSLYENKTRWGDKNDSDNADLYNTPQELEVSIQQKNEDKSNQRKPWIQYTSITLRAAELPGSKFVEWEWSGGSSAETVISLSCPDADQMDDAENDDDNHWSSDVVYTAKFIARTYYAYKQPNDYEVITIDQAGNIINDDLKVAVIPTFGLRAVNNRTNVSTDVFAQTADNNGENAQASYIWDITAPAASCHTYYGWKTSSENYNNATTNNACNVRTTSEDSNAPAQHTVYVVYKRDPFNLMEYDAENKITAALAMPYSVENGVQTYTENIPGAELTTKYYRLVLGATGDVEVTSDDGDFSASLATEDGKQILIVTPGDNAEQGTIYISVGDKQIAALHLTVNVKPVYVTLNPAEDLTGTYSYTQSTTGTKVFNVTTSPVVKQMITATDYSFSFSPTPQDASKYQFDRWIIRDAEENVIAEYVEPNLTHTFKGDESITPVFTAKDRAVFIVKSEPDVKYVDLQKALDRAAALGAGQVVTVYAPQKQTTPMRLIQGDYVIDKGVTLLIPGESSYKVITTQLDEDHFDENLGESGFSTYCTLAVDDNTTITVKNGNISLYAVLSSKNRHNGQAGTHGHLLLGKNCQITVEKGGLYAFGFITGDNSSHVTMKDGTVVYEAFYFRDWIGGTEAGKFTSGHNKVFPAGQYYIQNVEVPLTLECGAEEYVSTCVTMSLVGEVAANAKLIAPYYTKDDPTKETDLCLFGIDKGTTLTKTYDPATDRIKFEFEGSGISSKVKLGHLNLNFKSFIGGINIDSKNYVTPIQNNIDIDVKNTTINVQYDMAFLPGTVMRVHEDAVINVNKGASMFIYDRSARKHSDGVGFWSPEQSVIVPIFSNTRPGGVQYGHWDANSKFVAGRTEADLVDARLIINGNMDIHGALYTVKGEVEVEDHEYGADISSEGSGKINVFNIGTLDKTYQWKFGNGPHPIPLTSPNLLLHNNVAKQPAGESEEYTVVVNDNNTDIATSALSYTYYQHDGTWRLPIAGITGIKLYDAEDNEINNFYVTLPNANVTGYLLATLEPMGDVIYDESDFTIQLSQGNVTIVKNENDEEEISIVGDQLRIPVKYNVQNKDGEYNQTLTITNSTSAEFECGITEPIKVVEDYTPIFTAPTALNIYGRVSEDNPAALPIQPAEKNITTFSESNDKMDWEYDITGTNKSEFAFEFGEGAGNMLSGARVIFRPTTAGQKKATLTLTATYTDANNPVTVRQKVHTVTLVGNAMKNANTLDFNNVGAITINTEPFDLLRGINSPERITVTTEQVGTDVPSDVAEITPIDPTLPNSNYTFRPEAVGQLKVKVSQPESDAYEGKTNPVLEKIFMVVADPRPLTDVSCVDDETNFGLLTANRTNVTYDNAQIQFASTEAPAVWTAQFASMPGLLTFTPHGNGQWAIQESKDGRTWSELIWWTELPNDEEVTIPLTPSSRYVQIQYINANGESHGYITELCINPFSIHAETMKLYVPVEGGVVRNTSIVFTHATEPENIQVSGPDGWTVTPNPSGNIGGLKNPYYQTTVTLSGGQNVEELNNGFTLTAKQTTDNATATIALATFNFPKPLPMQSALWKSDDDEDNDGYDKAEHYYLYLHDSEYAKWDAENQTIVFMNKGSHIDANRRVAFGYHGLPAQVRFQSHTIDWMIEEGVETMEGVEWNPTNTETRVITSNNVINTITQPINHTAKFVRVSYVGTEPSEVTIQNVVIEGFPSATAPAEVEIAKANDQATSYATFDIHVMNLPKMQLVLDNTSEFRMLHGDVSNWNLLTNTDVISTSDYPTKMKMNEEGKITIKVEWIGTNLVNEGTIQILNPDQSNKVMATVRLVGKKSNITKADANTGIWTGVPTGYTLADDVDEKKRIFEPYTYHEVNVQNAFDADGKALFNYMVIYGETTTTDNSKTITRPNSTEGSNAKTPYYIYERADDGMSYRFVQAVENANSASKANLSEISHFTVVKEENGAKFYAIKPTLGEPLSFYLTGFCPYATTGSTKDDEGVWHFHGEIDDQMHIYLEDCHIYSRTKSVSGHTTSKTGEDSPDFDEDVVKGSGAVLVFENAHPQEGNPKAFNVSIHTRGHNLLKSNYGCYYKFIGTLKATQISSPVQVRLGDAKHFSTARTELNFDDVWPIIIDDRDFDEHTNGFLSLKKQSNNAPSIDLGNANTVVNFRGGQVQLQNAQIVSPNYKTTLAISYRSGLMGNVNIPMAYGIGTDEVGGTVNFYDGTTTVVPMTVQEEYREYYLMDQVQAKNEDNTPKVDAEGNPVMVDGTTTSCLRTPTNTYVYGGSHCMMRACNHVTSKGGAPKDGPDGVLLGRYVYNNTNADQGYTYRCVVAALPTGNLSEQYLEGYELIYENNLYVVNLTENKWDLIGPAPFTDPCYIVTPTNFPGDLRYNGALLSSYYSAYPNGKYSLHSVTPDANGDLSFWVPGGVVPGVAPEEDKQLSAWKACMTEIEAGLMGITGTIGGNTSVEFDEEVKNLLYCQLDQNIYDIISEPDPNAGVDEHNKPKGYTYQAPVVDPTGMWETKYLSIPPTYVGDLYNSIVSENDYIVTNKIYYVTTALADTWMNFTMPFDVEKIWVVETFSEAKIEEFFAKEDKTAEEKKAGETDMDATLRFQARHNADFAAFFGVAMAIGDNSQTFEDIYDGYIDWAKNKADKDNGLYTSGTYSLRGKYPLTHYDGSNFKTSNFYLYKNTSDWTIKDADNSEFVTKWQIVPKVNEGDVLMEKGETYSMLFPYCLGCDVQFDDNNKIIVDKDGVPVLAKRDYWDYWSGKFLIFESTQASLNTPHVVKGSNYIEKQKVGEAEWLFDSFIEDEQKAVLTGNSTFAMMPMEERGDMLDKIYTYAPEMGAEKFYPYEADEDGDEIDEYPVITPTSTFLYVGTKMATPAKLITRDGRIVYGPTNSGDGNTTGTHMPTVGGGNDLFITAINGGINVAVAAPQHVRVLSATGAVLYSGMVQTAVDVNLPTDGIYIVSGEREVQKILY